MIMDFDFEDTRNSWSHQFQATSCGGAVDRAISYWRTNVVSSHFSREPDEVVAVGPFPITMRQEAVNKHNNVDGVWDITIRWY